jgi:hypothetical protein
MYEQEFFEYMRKCKERYEEGKDLAHQELTSNDDKNNKPKL